MSTSILTRIHSEKLPTSSAALNFDVAVPVRHNIKLFVQPPTLPSLAINNQVPKFNVSLSDIAVKSSQADHALTSKSSFQKENSQKSDHKVLHTPYSSGTFKDTAPIPTTSLGTDVVPEDNSINLVDNWTVPGAGMYNTTSSFGIASEALDFPPIVNADDKKTKIKLKCMITESLLSTEKAGRFEKYELQGVTSGVLVKDNTDAQQVIPTLTGSLGLAYNITDTHTAVKAVATASKSVACTTINSHNGYDCTASIGCTDLNSALSAQSAAVSLPPFPVIKYAIREEFRPVVMKVKHMLNNVTVLPVANNATAEGSDISGDISGDTHTHTNSSENNSVCKLQLLVHALINTKVITSNSVHDLLVQVSCAPLLSAAPPGTTIKSITVVPSSKYSQAPSGSIPFFNPASKIITWSCGAVNLREAAAITVEALVELGQQTAGSEDPNIGTAFQDAFTLSRVQLPMVVKGVCNNMLLSKIDITCAPHSTSGSGDDNEAADLFGDTAGARNEVSNAVVDEVVEFRKQTKLECRFL